MTDIPATATGTGPEPGTDSDVGTGPGVGTDWGVGADSGVGVGAGADLDRRVLAAGTHLRFALLVMLIAGACVSLLSIYTADLVDGGTPRRLLVGAGTAVVFGAACLIHVLTPAWKKRRSHVLPVTDPELRAELDALVDRAGLVKRPDFRLNLAATPSAAAFGRWGSHTVLLHGGLLVQRARDPEGFRFVVLHELAHIRNRDVGVAYAAEALWRAVAVLVLLPCAVLALYPQPWDRSLTELAGLWQDHWSLALRGLFRVACLLALILLARADVLRTRELYADLDAARWSGGRRGLPVLAPETGLGRMRRALRGLAAAWRTHPAWTERTASLLEPGPMFGVRASTMFLTGVVAIVAFVDVDLVVQRPSAAGQWYADVTDWTTAGLVTAIAGVAVWRAVTYAVVTRLPAPSGLRAGLWLGLGLACGELLTFRHAGAGWLPPAPQALLALVAGTAVLLWWAAQSAELWVTTCRGRSLMPSHLLGLTALFLVFGGWFAWWLGRGHLFQEGNFLAAIDWDSLLPGMYPNTPADQLHYLDVLKWLAFVPPVTSEPLILVGGTVLWLFPLAVWSRGQGTDAARWLRRARPSGPWPDLNGSLPPLRWLLARAAAGGAFCVLVVLATRLWLHADRPPAGLRGGAWQMHVSVITVLAVFAAVALTVCVVYATTSRHRLPLALTAGGSALLLGLAGTLLLTATQGCVPGTEVSGSGCFWYGAPGWFMIHVLVAPYMLGLGFYAVVLAALVGLTLNRPVTALRTRRRPRAPRRPQAGDERPRGRKAAGRGRARRRMLVWAALGTATGLLTAAATRAALAAVRPEPDTALFADWAQKTALWTSLSLITCTALATVLTRFRFPLVLVAGGSVFLGGLAGTLALSVFDGCVPGLAVLAGTCAVRPGPTWDLAQGILLPRLAGIGLPVLAVAALCVLAVRRRTARLAPARPGTRKVHRLTRRAYVLVACTAPLLLLTGQQHLVATTDPNTGPGQRAAAARAKAEQREAVTTWLNGGGGQVMNYLARDYKALAKALAGTKTTGQYPKSVYQPICDDWGLDGGVIAADYRPPVAKLSDEWQTMIEHAERGARLCQAGLTSGSQPLTQIGIADLTVASGNYMVVAVGLLAITEPGA
ncbi:Zn-dependent protease with chaperone function [Streptomyces sp. V4I8]|uniref:M48 family metalloprotease n=1 Tax=Streptomyces sp. V4I8 TaxID=3156469 RepID=UPI003513328B